MRVSEVCKGSDVMQKLSAEQKIKVLAEFFKKETERLYTLPEDEARKVALSNLYSAGIVDEKGNYTAPYVALKN